MRGGSVILLGSRLAEPVFGRLGILAAQIVPTKQEVVRLLALLTGQFLDQRKIGWRDRQFRVGVSLDDRPPCDLATHRLEFRFSIDAAFQRQKRFEIGSRQDRHRLLHGRETLLGLFATAKDIAIGVDCALLALCAGKRLGDTPQHIDVAAGKHRRIGRGNADHGVVLLDIGRVDELFARLGEGEPVKQVGRDLPLGFARLCGR